MIFQKVQVVISDTMNRVLESSAARISFQTIVICQLTAASVSLVASSVMVIMIIRTEKRLSTPYRRIIFALGMSDMIWSLAMVTGPFFVPSDTPLSWGMGNEGTCRASGFAIYLFYTGTVPMYTCFLCFYYLCKLKYRMTNEEFARRFEYKVHLFINAFSVTVTSLALALDTFHPGAFRVSCVVATTPLGCRFYPQIVGECDSTIEARVNDITIASQSLRLLWFVGMITIMGTLYWHVIATNRLHSCQSGTIQRAILPNHDSVSADDENSSEDEESSGIPLEVGPSSVHDGLDAGVRDFADSDEDNAHPSEASGLSSAAHSQEDKMIDGDIDIDIGIDPDILQRQQQQQQQALNQRTSSRRSQTTNLEYLSALYRNEIAIQGTCYIMVYFLTHFPTILFYAILMADKTPPRWSQVLPFVCAPLGGFLLMLAYTRPQIAHLRRINPGLSRLKGFWLVLKAGGEVPEEHEQQINDIHHRPTRGRNNLNPHGLCRQMPQDNREESMSSIQFGAIMGDPCSSESPYNNDMASSVLVMDGKASTLSEGDLNYTPESQWSYVKGGTCTSSRFIKEASSQT